MNNDPIQWPNARAYWTPAGYQVQLDVWLDARGSSLFAERLEDALVEISEVLSYEWIHGSYTRSRTGAEADPGRLTITATRGIFTVEPSRLHDLLGDLARDCDEEAARLDKADEALAQPWLRALHRRAGKLGEAA